MVKYFDIYPITILTKKRLKNRQNLLTFICYLQTNIIDLKREGAETICSWIKWEMVLRKCTSMTN